MPENKDQKKTLILDTSTYCRKRPPEMFLRKGVLKLTENLQENTHAEV